MKKIIAVFALAIIIISCTVVNSIYKDQIAYYSIKVAVTGIEITNQAVLAFNATKAGKTDSILIYVSNGLALNAQLAIYQDSLLYYTNKK